MKTGKFTVTMILTVLVTSAVCVFLTGRAAVSKNEKTAETLCRVISSEVYSEIERKISSPVNISLTMANTSLLSEMLENEKNYTDAEFTAAMTGYLSQIKESLGVNTAFVISDGSKKYFTYEGLNKVISPEKNSHDIWYSTFINGRKKYDIDIDSDEVNNGQWTVFVNARIEDSSGKLLGVCGTGVNINDLRDMLGSYSENYGSDIRMADSDGTVMINTSSVSIDSAVLTDIPYTSQYGAHIMRTDRGTYEMNMFSPDLNLNITVNQPVQADETVKRFAVPAAAAFLNCAVFLTGITLLRKKAKASEKSDTDSASSRK